MQSHEQSATNRPITVSPDHLAMGAQDRSRDRALRRASRLMTDFGDEVRQARLTAGISQRAVGAASGISHSNVSRIEHGRLQRLSIAAAVVLADAVGLDVSFKLYPGRMPTRDGAHGERLRRLLTQVGPPLKFGTEVPLPPRDGPPEQRSWDAVIYAEDGQTGVELEMRLYDIQAQMRRIRLKWRDGGVERLLLVIADAAANRRAMRSFADYFADLPQLRTATVLSTLRAGHRPPTGLILL